MEQLSCIAADELGVQDARSVLLFSLIHFLYSRQREKHIAKLEAKIERRKTQVKNTIKHLRQYKTSLAASLEKRNIVMLERKNQLDLIIADYKLECRKLAEEDTRDLHEFYIWAKEEIGKCAESAVESAPIEDNTEIMRAIQGVLKNCQ